MAEQRVVMFNVDGYVDDYVDDYYGRDDMLALFHVSTFALAFYTCITFQSRVE